MSSNTDWVYYKNAMIPTVSPHREADTADIHSGKVWKEEGKHALFARWTSDFDCGYETSWWYVIKDDPFNIAALNSNTRYKINKGKRLFEVRVIDPLEYKEQIWEIQVSAYQGYPEKYRPSVDKEKLYQTIEKEWIHDNVKVFGAFYRETGKIVGYTFLRWKDKCIELVAQKVKPEFEKYQVNAALVGSLLDMLENQLASGYYICDGARNIQHETAFQDYLEKYFHFRKAYCRLNVVYRPGVKWLVKCLYLIREPLKKLGNIRIIHKVNGVLQMEAILREQKEK